VERKLGTDYLYRIGIACKYGIEPFSPFLPDPALIDSKNIRTFLLSKLINAERAAIRSKVFMEKIQRTRLILLSNIVQEFLPNSKTKKDKVKKNSDKSIDKGGNDNVKVNEGIQKFENLNLENIARKLSSADMIQKGKYNAQTGLLIESTEEKKTTCST